MKVKVDDEMGSSSDWDEYFNLMYTLSELI